MIRQTLLFFLCFPFFVKAQFGYNDNYDSIKQVIIEKGRQAYFDKDLDKLESSTEKVFSMYTKDKDSALLAKYYHFKALQKKLVYQNDSAFFYYHRSKNISKKTNDSIQVGRRLLSIANLQRQVRDFLGSEISSIEALKFLEPKKSYVFLVYVYNNLGLVSEELNQLEDAKSYYYKALEFNKLIDDQSQRSSINNNLGLLYQRSNDHKKAVSFFKRGLDSINLDDYIKIDYATLLENLTFSEYKLGKKDFIIDRYEEVLKIRKKFKENNELCTTHLNIANYYFDNKESTKAKHHAELGLSYAKQTHNNQRLLEALYLLSGLSSGNESKEYLEEYITLNDSLITQERQLKNQFAKIRYETDKKEKENTFLKSENEKRLAEVEKQRQQKTIGWLVATLSILILGSSVSFFSFRRKKLLFQAQLQKVEAREKERRQIAKSLHDEVAGDLRLLHQKLAQTNLLVEAEKLELVKDNVRNLSHQLSSVSFEKVNFTDQIINLISDYFAPNFIIRAHHLKDINWEEVDNPIKRVLYLSIRESIQNCEKYAQASRVDISFKVHKKSVLLKIQDNGIGFDTTTSKKGIGLQNMQERVEELQGKLIISSEVQKGTNIEIQVPLNA
ncbi:tetratricopeptide repeat-containing sensor histidine kinase [Tenacibaculum jejuense]|uniref:histidine kinase n=1 Tax=Tenacibaculum jejuense TaxID=584609 RepID=A0A238UFI4_9FLAO|nr:tetratricopeptide repeat-containing sensor histidine kinase [Tenacibaculum jejuense]SNR17746.1 putative Histidine kinase [Tenacibaculum jejuense]